MVRRIGAANVATADGFRLSQAGSAVAAVRRLGIMAGMLDSFSRWLLAAPHRKVLAGLWMFLAGGVALLAGALGRMVQSLAGGPMALAERFPGWPTAWVPESALGYTAASLLVCWGVWAIGAGARQAAARR